MAKNAVITTKSVEQLRAELKAAEAELKAAEAALLASKANTHAAEIKATVALVAWLDKNPAFCKAHYQTAMKARYAHSKGGYVGQWAFDLAKAAGFKG